MGKPATNVGGRNGVERLFDRRDQRLNRPCLGTAQKGFDLRPTLLDGVEVWRIGRQPEEPCAPRRQQLFYPGHFVGRQMIPQHTSAGLQGRTQDLADPAVNNCAIDGAVNDPRGLEAVQAQGREQSLMSAIILGHTLDHPLSRGGPPEAACHGQVDSRFIHQFQPVDVEIVDGLAEGGAQRLDALRVALRGVERLFLPAA
jgi:hypothetical protein